MVALIAILAIWVAVHESDAARDPAFEFIALLVATYALVFLGCVVPLSSTRTDPLGGS